MMRKNPFAGLMAVALNLLLFAGMGMTTASCIADADDDEAPAGPAGDSISAAPDSLTFTVDSAFQAPATYLVGEWLAEYIGFDANPEQMKTSAIRRRVVFSADGTYHSYVKGVMDVSQDTLALYTDFEHEHGTYSLDAERQLLTYTVTYDSLINFLTDELEYLPGKLVQGVGLLQQYEERLLFTPEYQGRRRWVRIDGNLKSAADSVTTLTYVMNKQQ